MLCLMYKLCPSIAMWGICTSEGSMYMWSSYDGKVLLGIVLLNMPTFMTMKHLVIG